MAGCHCSRIATDEASVPVHWLGDQPRDRTSTRGTPIGRAARYGQRLALAGLKPPSIEPDDGFFCSGRVPMRIGVGDQVRGDARLANGSPAGVGQRMIRV